MSRLYNCLPSEIICIDDEYTAYCFNEACALILIRLQKGEKPRFQKERFKGRKDTHFTNFSDMYKYYK